MKLLEKNIVPNQSGTVKILPEDPDDTRKINPTPDSGGKKNITRVRVKLELKVAAVEYTKSSSVI